MIYIAHSFHIYRHIGCCKIVYIVRFSLSAYCYSNVQFPRQDKQLFCFIYLRFSCSINVKLDIGEAESQQLSRCIDADCQSWGCEFESSSSNIFFRRMTEVIRQTPFVFHQQASSLFGNRSYLLEENNRTVVRK